MADKPKLKYHIKSVYNPKTGGTLLRPIITDRTSMNLDQTVKYALNAAYVRGQFNDMRGVLNGFIEAIQQLGKDGYDVCLNNWLRVHGELTGSVGEDRQLTSANEYKVGITALTDLKRDVSEFSWTNVDDTGVQVKIDSLFSVGGEPGIITKSKDIMVTGKYMQYKQAYGDKVTIDYEGLSTPVVITPSESDYAHQKFAWPTLLDEIEDGTILTFKFRLRGGIEGAPDQVITRTAIYHAA